MFRLKQTKSRKKNMSENARWKHDVKASDRRNRKKTVSGGLWRAVAEWQTVADCGECGGLWQ